MAGATARRPAALATARITLSGKGGGSGSRGLWVTWAQGAQKQGVPLLAALQSKPAESVLQISRYFL